MIEERLRELGLELPAPLASPPGVRLPFELVRVHGDVAYVSGLKQELGELDRVTAWLKVLGFVKCGPDFNVTPAAINGFTDLIIELWGDAGRHARSAIGAGELPFGMPVEVEAVVAIA